MNFKDKVVDKLFSGVIADRVNEAVKKRITSARNNEREDATYRRITQIARTRDLSGIKQDKMIRVVDWLVDRNPQAKRIINTFTDFIIGDGITYTAENPELKDVLDEFWSMNEWDLKQSDRISELSKYGEQIYKPFVNEHSGIVNLGVFDPEMVDKIIRDKENAEMLKELVPKSDKSIKYDIMRRNHKEDGKIEGEIFFFNVNRGSHGTRGKSDMLPIADWLDMYDKTLFTMAERVPFLLSFLWDIKIQNAGENELNDRLFQLLHQPPKAGSFNIHNENEEWNAVTPDLKGADFTDFLKLLKTQLTSGSGLPAHWLFGFGDDINKAVSQEISEPTYRQLKRRQEYVKYMFEFLFDYQIQNAIEKGTLKEVPKDAKENPYEYQIILPDPSRKETGIIAETMSKVVPALAISISNGIVSEDTAMKVLNTFINQLGVDVDNEDEKKEIDKPTEKVVEAVSKLYKELEKNKVKVTR